MRVDRAGGLADRRPGPKWNGGNDSNRSASGGRLPNRRPRRRSRGCPQTSSIAHRTAVDSPRSGQQTRRHRGALANARCRSCAPSVRRRRPFTNRTTLSHALQVRPDSTDRDGSPGAARQPEPIPAGDRRTPWKGGVHNRFAGRPEPMVWRPSGEIRFMAWTLNRNRRRDCRRRHRPGLEHLDDRCLLSTGAGTTLPHHAVPAHRARRRSRLALPTRLRFASTSLAGRRRRHRGAAHAVSLAASAANRSSSRPVGRHGHADGLRPDHRRRGDPLGLRRRRHGMTVAVIDTGVDYNNPALGGGFGPGAKVDRRLQLRHQHGRPAGHDLAARHRRRRADRLERSQPPGRRAGRQYRGPQGHRRQQLGQPEQHRPGPPVGHRPPQPVQHHRRQHVAVRRRQLRPELVRPGRRRRPADHRPGRPAAS